jgi:hypothetical protein
MTTEQAETTFGMPSIEMADHALRELGYGDRLILTRMNPASGHDTIDIYNFMNAVELISETRWAELSMAGGSRTGIVWVNPLQLGVWLRDVIGDAELAEKVEEGFAAAGNYKDQIAAIAPVLQGRAEQYRAVLEVSSTE